MARDELISGQSTPARGAVADAGRRHARKNRLTVDVGGTVSDDDLGVGRARNHRSSTGSAPGPCAASLPNGERLHRSKDMTPPTAHSVDGHTYDRPGPSASAAAPPTRGTSCHIGLVEVTCSSRTACDVDRLTACVTAKPSTPPARPGDHAETAQPLLLAQRWPVRPVHALPRR